MKILVTGGAGFIGSFLVKELLRREHSVTVLDNLSSATFDNLKSFRSDFTFIRSDILGEKENDEAVKENDYIIHLAALVNVQESFKYPELYDEINTRGTLNLLKSAVKNKTKWFAFASTCAVYGKPESLPVGEHHNPRPLSPYAISKLKAETHCQAFAQKGL
ncbi:MAG: NAD-dependent epimerase/dehydratase family protein, partial [Nitrososphaerales archaeon]